MAITKEQEAIYIESGGINCPVCRSSDIESRGDAEYHDNTLSETVICNQCGEKWLDIYTLSGAITV